MKILIDIGHPAHVHLFKNFAWIMQERGNKVFFTTREKEFEINLLRKYGFEFMSFGKKYKSTFGKIFGLFQFDFKMLLAAMRFKPDIFLSHGSIYAAQIAWLLKKPHVSLEDTGNWEQMRLYLPFTSAVLTPKCLQENLGKKQLRYNGYHELSYLHSKYFTPDPSILDLLKVKKDEKYIIMRFVSWTASHDIGHSGLSLEMKKKAVKELSKYARVFISSESELPEDLKPYQIKIPPERMHDALAFATLFVGESGTMSTECAVLGTPNIQIRHTLEPDKVPGVHLELVKRGLKVLKQSDDIDGIISMSRAILDNYQVVKNDMTKNREKLLMDSIDVTDFMCWFVENYPTSKKLEYKEGCAESFG